MYSEVFGRRVNLVYVTIIVAVYDLFHILQEFRDRFNRFEAYENSEFGCMSSLLQAHCIDTFAEVAVYSLDFILTAFLIYGASQVRQNLNFKVRKF